MFYSRQIDSVLRLVAKYGQTVTWRKATSGIVDTNKPWIKTEDLIDTYFPKVLFLPKYWRTTGTSEYIMGEIPTGEMIGYMGNTDSLVSTNGVIGLTVSINDTLLVGTKEYILDPFEALNPNGEGVILYELRFKL